MTKHEDLRSNSVLFAGKRRGETLSSREDRLHRKARAARRARSDCSRPEDEGKNKPVLARLHDSFSPGVAHGAISRAGDRFLSFPFSGSLCAKQRKTSWENGDPQGDEAFPGLRAETVQRTRRHVGRIRAAGARIV